MSYNLPPIMTTEEVADFFRTSTETIHRMERSGEIESIPGLRRRVKRYRREVVLALLDDEAESQ
ncbi:helix-turn-helix domain-containing protein [Bradyrhizobium ottawaense]|uniref:helix-turn-helix domain-containing protein n=1 Tax=Bradyrhizobium ottawaense TaxID=931866 RepID=UPI003516F2F6